MNGYAYKQITGDSGSGAVLGDFEGQVFALGPALDYTFQIGQTPVVTNLRYFYEFDVENRTAGACRLPEHSDSAGRAFGRGCSEIETISGPRRAGVTVDNPVSHLELVDMHD